MVVQYAQIRFIYLDFTVKRNEEDMHLSMSSSSKRSEIKYELIFKSILAGTGNSRVGCALPTIHSLTGRIHQILLRLEIFTDLFY